MKNKEHPDKQYYFDKPENIRKVKIVFGISIIALFLIDFVIHRHIYISWEELPGFYAIYGFAAYVSLVAIAEILRKFVRRGVDYYD